MTGRARGFTLIELLVAIAVVAVLALIALPSLQGRIVLGQVVDAVHWTDAAKAPIAAAWATQHALPADNAAAGLPAPDKMVSDLVSSVTVEGGALQLRFGNRANAALQGRTLTLRPAVVDDAPIVPVTWLCGHAAPPPQMTAKGTDRTTVAPQNLPLNCR